MSENDEIFSITLSNSEQPQTRTIAGITTVPLVYDILNNETNTSFRLFNGGYYIAPFLEALNRTIKLQVILLQVTGVVRVRVTLIEEYAGQLINFFTTPFLMDWEIEDYISTQLKDILQQYETQIRDFRIDQVVITTSYGDGFFQGVKGKSLATINKTFHIIDLDSSLNCVWKCFYIQQLFDYNTLKKFAKRIKDKKKIDNSTTQFKKKIIKEHELTFFKEGVRLKEIIELAKVLEYNIHIYNNVFEKTKTVEYKNFKKEICIRLSSNHASLLIPKTKIKDLGLLVDRKLLGYFKDEKVVTFNRKIYVGGFGDNYTTEEFNEILIEEKEKVRDLPKRTIKRWQIPKKKEKDYSIGTYDIETFLDKDSGVVPYCIGLYLPINGVLVYKSFYGLKCITNFFNYLDDQKENINNLYLFAHNGGKFDVLILLRHYLLKSNIFNIDKSLMIDGAIVNLELTFTNEEGEENRIYFRDSIRILPGSLKNLCNDFEVEHSKLEFDHSKVKPNNFMDFKEEVLPYLKHDCMGLLEIIIKFNELIIENNNIHIWEINTIASLSKKIFLQNYYKDSKNVLYTLDYKMDELIRRSYYGGRNEAFKYGDFVDRDIVYLDFTSLYPDRATIPLPTGRPIVHKEVDEFIKIKKRIYKEFLNPDIHFQGYYQKLSVEGFILCDIVSYVNGDKEVPFIPYKDPVSGRLLFPLFKNWKEVVMSTNDLDYIYERELSYCIKIKKIIEFTFKPILKNFMLDGFKGKAEATAQGKKALALLHKLKVNSGYGFFALKTSKKTILFIPKEEADYEVFNYWFNGDLIHFSEQGKYIILHINNEIKSPHINIAVASEITAASRRKLHDLLTIAKSFGDLYYCDTDSVLFSCKNKNIDEKITYFKKRFFEPYGALGGLKDEIYEKAVKEYGNELTGFLIGHEYPYYMLKLTRFIVIGCKCYYGSYLPNMFKDYYGKEKFCLLIIFPFKTGFNIFEVEQYYSAKIVDFTKYYAIIDCKEKKLYDENIKKELYSGATKILQIKPLNVTAFKGLKFQPNTDKEQLYIEFLENETYKQVQTYFKSGKDIMYAEKEFNINFQVQIKEIEKTFSSDYKKGTRVGEDVKPLILE